MRKNKNKKQDAETDGVGGRCEENSIWCQTRNSRRLFSFRVERTALGEVSVGEWKRSGVSACVCLCVCEQLRHLATKNFKLRADDVGKT